MKKIILIVSIVISLVGITFVALPSILKISGMDRPLKDYLFKKILQDKNIEVDLTDFKVGLGTFELSNLSVTSAGKSFHVTIRSVQFVYDLAKLLLHPLDPMQALSAISIIEPQILFSRDSSAVGQGSSQQWLKALEFVQRVAREKGIQFFRVEKGSAVLKLAYDKQIMLADDLSGILKTTDFNVFKLNLDGNLLGNQLQKINLAGELDLKREKFKILNHFNQFQFNPSELSRFYPQLSALQANLNGWLLIENEPKDYRNVQMNGQLSVNSAALRLGTVQLDSLSARVIVNANQLFVDSLQARMANAPLKGRLYVKNIFQPDISGKLQFDGVPIARLFPDIKNPILQKSRITLKTFFQFDPAKKRLNLRGEEGVLTGAGGVRLHDVAFRFQNSSDSINVTYLRAVYAKRDTLRLNFSLFRPLALASFNITAKHSGGRHVILDRLDSKQHDIQISGQMNFKKETLRGTWRYTIFRKADSVLALNGILSGTRKNVAIKLLRANKKDFKAQLELSDLFGNWTINNGLVLELPLEKFTTIESLRDFFEKTHTYLKFSGSFRQGIFSEIVLSKKGAPENRVELLARISNPLSETKRIDGQCRLKNITGHFGFDVSPEKMDGGFNFQNQLSGNIHIDLKKSEYLAGNLNFRDFKIIKALSDSIAPGDFRLEGTLNGQVDLGGTFKNPQIAGQISGDRFVFNDVGYYQSYLKFEANKSVFKLDSLFIAINNLPVIAGKGFADIKNDSLNARFSAQDVDFEQLWFTFFDTNPRLTGTSTYDMQLKGSIKRPEVHLDLQMENGYLDRIPFDHFSADVRNKYLNGGSILDFEHQAMVFDRLEMIKRERYALNALGEIPFDPTQNLDVFINFKGDLLGLIPYYQPFFEKAVSDVDMHLAFGGSLDQLRLSSGYLLINKGELWMKNVARHVSNISGVVEKKGDSNQINIINLSAERGGETLTINTVRDVRLADGRRLQPWYIKNFDLDFGVLQLTTTGHGVRLHIPGLMVEGDEGRLYLTGMAKGEDFYFAGPLKHPVAHGKVVLYDTRLTFPFLSQGAPVQKNNAVLNFLQNIDWDVLTVSGEDVLYFREIPAYIDNVNTELYIDESSPGLHFSGILNEGTFKVSGQISSSRGRLEYLDQTFRVDYFQAEFTENSPYPIISGQAWTTIRDSIGAIPKTIYLKLYAIDPDTRQEKQQGSWEDFKFKLVSADPKIGESQELVLADLGFSVGNIANKVTSVGGAVTEKYIFRPLFRPLERVIERNLGLDMVRFNSNIARNLFYSSLGFGKQNFARSTPLINPFNTQTPYLFLMQSSEITLGKYVTQNLFLTYTGQLVSFYDQSRPSFDINHSFGIEYRFLRNILLEIEYDRELMGYYKIQNQKQYLEDIKIRLRHSFTF